MDSPAAAPTGIHLRSLKNDKIAHLRQAFQASDVSAIPVARNFRRWLLLTAVRNVVNENPERFRGLRGEDGERIRGPKGDKPSAQEVHEAALAAARQVVAENADALRGEKGAPGMTTSEIKQVIIEVLSDIGLRDNLVAKLLQVKTELRQALHKATSRNIAELQTVYRKIDDIIS